MSMEMVGNFLPTQGADLALKIVGTIVAWIIGRWLIGKALERGKKIDATRINSLKSIISVGRTVVLIRTILGISGVQTASFAALPAGVGRPIGTARGGLLAHFAAGIFLQLLRPGTVGDFTRAVGTAGAVKALGLFTATLFTRTL